MTLEHANEMVIQLLKDAREPHYPHLVDAADVFSELPTDVQLLDALVEAFDTTPIEMIERLICFDFVALRRMVMQGEQAGVAA
jgi:hypothetical protein